jgi:hypothetical protein
MKAGVSVKLSSARWHVPQVLPLPANVSLKKSALPRSTAVGSGSGRGQPSTAARQATSLAEITARAKLLRLPSSARETTSVVYYIEP